MGKIIEYSPEASDDNMVRETFLPVDIAYPTSSDRGFCGGSYEAKVEYVYGYKYVDRPHRRRIGISFRIVVHRT